MAAGDGILVPSLSFSSWVEERKSERELGWSLCLQNYPVHSGLYQIFLRCRIKDRFFLAKILKRFARSSARLKEVHLNPGHAYIPMLFAGDSLSFGMQPRKCF